MRRTTDGVWVEGAAEEKKLMQERQRLRRIADRVGR